MRLSSTSTNMVVPLLLPYSQKEMPFVGAPVLRHPGIDGGVLEVMDEARVRDHVDDPSSGRCWGLPAPGTGAGGVAVVEIATRAVGVIEGDEANRHAIGICPAGRPASKSSMTGSAAASAGTANGETNN